MDWLKAYNVPIELVPFTVYADSQGVPKYLQLEGIVTSPEVKTDIDSWAGHWIFNTNETNAPGAYSRMFEKNVAAVFNYANGSANLEGASVDDVVLAYVNQQGIRAAGVVLDPHVTLGTGIFLDATRKQLPNEYHLRVQWEAIVPEGRGVTSSEAIARGYNLPVRSVFAKLHRGSRASRIEKEVRDRARSTGNA